MKDHDKRTRIAYLIEAGFEHFIALFVTGTMLGYILDTLGFSDAMQGIISTVATFTCGAQLFALLLVGKRRRRIVTLGHFINQSCFALLYLLPLFDLGPNTRTVLLVGLLFTGHIINNAINPAKITWLMGSVKNEHRGRFTAVKEMLSLAGGIAVSVGFGRVADVYRSADGMPTRPYYVICSIALTLMMLIHTATLLVSREKPEPTPERTSVRSTVARLFRSRELIRVIGVGILWNIASAISVSFFASYLREELAFSFTTIALMSTLGSVCRIAASPLLGRIADKHSFATSMTISFAAAALAFLSMSFTAPTTRWLYLVYACLHAFAMAGINSGVINLIYDYVAPADRAVAMGVKNALGGILAFFTALLSGLLLGKIQTSGGIHLFGITVYAQQALALISTLVIILLIIYMLKVIAPLKKVDISESDNS